ncbi:hypothetical protein ENT52713_28640 [Enterobacter sp. 200527-13]|uniref:hypothetical protein n=1 Tax=Enterobacter sp. 200527-13 TaxID=2995131 RepID=UPI0022C768FC|nr:hypothetical protein [Enterobacter sp. 200527-13]GLH25468.1 hypothetical protein ENT52713_28640 [Enterobacter sp. 200527-13]
MISLKAGSPVCNCKNPDTCIHMFSLKVGERTFTYKQADFISSVDVIDEDDKGVPVSMTLVDKGCVSNNSSCPQGIIFSPSDSKTLQIFNKGLTNYLLHYVPKVNYFKITDSVDFLEDYILAPEVLDVLPKNVYLLRLGECKGNPFINQSLSFMNGASPLLSMAPLDVLTTWIHVFAGFKWEVDLAIGLEHEVKEYTEKERKQQQKAENKSQGKSQRGNRGWTKKPQYEISNALEMEGKLNCSLGAIPFDYSPSLKKDFKGKEKKVQLLNKADELINTFIKTFSTDEGNDAKIKLLSTEIVYPQIEMKGGGELKEDSNSTQLYLQRNLSIELAPLIGVRLTLDLLQAFAAWYHADVVLAAAREGLDAGEDDYKEGKNSAYVGSTFELVVEGEFDLALQCTSDTKEKWHVEYNEDTAIKFGLTLNVNFRAGVRFYVANGALKIGGEASAEGFVGLEANHSEPSKVDLVLYHSDVIAKVYVSYTWSLGGDSGSGGGDNDGGRTKKNNISNDSEVNKDVEWNIYKKLEKKDSAARITLF